MKEFTAKSKIEKRYASKRVEISRCDKWSDLESYASNLPAKVFGLNGRIDLRRLRRYERNTAKKAINIESFPSLRGLI